MSATRRWPARSGYGADVQIPFTLRGIDGLVSVRVERNDAPELVGSGPDSLGFPWCHAAVAYPAQGYDAVVMDETMGTVPTNGDSQHLGLDAVIAYRRQFEREGLLRPGARFIAHHFSHGANPHHEALEEILQPHGIEVAYDGWRLAL
mgnify:CR=1 FL=1